MDRSKITKLTSSMSGRADATIRIWKTLKLGKRLERLIALSIENSEPATKTIMTSRGREAYNSDCSDLTDDTFFGVSDFGVSERSLS